MPTTFDVHYLGVLPDLDRIEGDNQAEGGADLVGLTIGSTAHPLFANIQTWSPGSTGFGGGAAPDVYDIENPVDTFRIDGGADQTFDGGMRYAATITYADGSTADITALVVQDTTGNAYLLPHPAYNADQALMEAQAITSITFNAVLWGGGVVGDGYDMLGNRYVAEYTAGVVDGTGGGDTMSLGYTDTDGDQITSGNDTIAGAGGDDVITGAGGNDTIYGGAGYDTIWFGDTWGDDIVFGDHASGEVNEDALDFSAVTLGGVTVTFTASEDGTASQGTNSVVFDNIERIYGTNLSDSIDASADAGGVELYGNGGDDAITGGSGNDVIDGGTGDDIVSGGFGDDIFSADPGDGDDIITDFNLGNTGTLADGNAANNDFIDLSAYYDDIWDLYADQADDGVLNQSNDGVGGVDYADNTSFAGGSLTFAGATADPSFFTVENTNVVCFAAGTRILTPRGDVPIEKLRAGDHVITRDHGPQRIRWIGASTVPRAPNLAPIRIKAGALGAGLPRRDLMVSPQHRMLLASRIVTRMTEADEVLVAATKLTSMPGIWRTARPGKVRYFHLLFTRHEIVFAEGAPTESLLPGPQARAAMGPEAWAELSAIFPDIGESLRQCLPARPVVRGALQKRLAARHRKNGVPLLEAVARADQPMVSARA